MENSERMEFTTGEISAGLENFLSFLRKIEEKNRIATDNKCVADAETIDILHKFELGSLSYHDCAKLGRKTIQVRENRRISKDIVCQTKDVVSWINSNQQVIKSLERLLGSVRKAEKSTENRYYTPRTKIVDWG